ncbi:MAG: hypothetical protein OJF61_000218 [Rhodanobacteraceae bacterium]|jgi:hypothetical protein|nr:MAG: hypothetical protein OJF61_000218 [Rhodanobacteraceae bacterium]
MRQTAAAVAGIAFVFAAGAACAATDPSTVLNAYRAASGGDAWNGKTVMKTAAKIAGQGLTGSGTTITDLRSGAFVEHYTLGPASGAQGFDGTNPWQQGPNGDVNLEKGGDALPLAINQAYRDTNAWWRPGFGAAAVVSDGVKPCGSSRCEVLKVSPRGGKPFDAWFDARTHLLVRTVEKQGAQTVTTDFSDYRAGDGVRLPWKEVIDNGAGAQYLLTVTNTSVAFMPAQPLAIYAPPKGTAGDFTIAGGATQTTFPFHLYNNHIYADAWVNGHGPLTFIFDTGGQNILVPATAKALGIDVHGAMPGGGVGDKTADYGLAKVATLRIGDVTFRNQVVGVLDFAIDGVEGVDMQGMAGFELFKRFVTRIDYGKHTITLIEPEHFDPRDAGTPIPFVFNDDDPEVEGSFEGIPAKFDIDTGARDALTLTAPFAAAHDLRATHPKGVEAVEGWGVGGASRGYVTRGKEVAIGTVKIPDVVTSFSTQKKGAFSSAAFQGNVGAGLLKRFVVTFDYPHHTMYLKPLPEPVADLDTYDRSGMWINAAKGGMQVMDVTASGPAAQAGIEAGDVVTEVNGKPAASIPVYELRRMLRDEAPGTVVHFTITRGAQSHKVDVKLRDQV